MEKNYREENQDENGESSVYRTARRSEFTFCDWNVPVLVEPTGRCIGRLTHSQFIGFTRFHVFQYFRLQPVRLNIVQHSRRLDRVAGFNSTKINFRRSGSVFNKSSFDENARALCFENCRVKVSVHPHVVQAPN